MTTTHADAPSLSPLQRAFLALEQARARLAVAEGAAREPVAIIGIGCRVPGADDPQKFWEGMLEGRDAIGPIPADRWNVEALYDADPDVPGRIATRAGGFLREVDRFDAEFFGISPREAHGMDPQQRLLLEVAWEALEQAGQPPDRLEGSRTGVFVGMCNSDYAYLQLKSDDAALLDAHFSSGVAHSIASGRLSYLLGLQGPSLTIDTACSSSLVAVHLACQSLRNEDCRTALAGGVNLILSPDVYIALSHSRMLAPDGRCKTFDATADGFARGEGCGVVVLKLLRDALADGDRVLAVIRGSAVNQDGASSGLIAPNGPAQEAVIREALERADVKPSQVGYIEAHGTGTQLGDPLEVRALGAVFGAQRDTAQPLLLGSVKTNIGHLEAAAGVTGLLKVVLALRHRMIPPHLHFRVPSPHIQWNELPLRVPTSALPWEPIDGRRIAGVSSFGFSGTNVHVVVEEAPAAPVSTEPARPAAPSCLLTLSARTEAALQAVARRYAEAVKGRADSELADICCAANTGRAHLRQRASIVARSIEELRSRLLAVADGNPADGVRTARVALRDPPRVAFLFTGQGAQYARMAHGLYEASSVFRAALDHCAQALSPWLARPLLDILFAAPTVHAPLDDTEYAQPALFAVEYALTELWRSWGIVPSVVMGHSLGEYVAACIAGVFSVDEGLRLVAKRGRLMQSLPAGGAMAAVFASERQVNETLATLRSGVCIAAINGPGQAVVSGTAAAVDEVCERLKKSGVRGQRLEVSHAFHSPLVEPILDALEAELSRTSLASPRLRLISNLSGQAAAGEEISRPGYWRRHARDTVRFADGLATLVGAADCIVEIGPHPTLLPFARNVLGEGAAPGIASLRKGTRDWDQMLDALASLYLLGAPINWRAFSDRSGPPPVELPTYPFQRERFWFTSQSRPPGAQVRGASAAHGLLGTALRSPTFAAGYEASISADWPAYVRQHRVFGHVVMPATAYLDTLIACARAVLRVDAVILEDVGIEEAMLLSDDGAARSMQTLCAAQAADGTVAATISSLEMAAADRAPWTAHVRANLRAGDLPPAAMADLHALRRACGTPIEPREFYQRLETRGLMFGADFRCVRQLWSGDSQAFGAIELDPEFAAQGPVHCLHPVLLDGCVQILAAVLAVDDTHALYMPIGIKRLALHRGAGARCWSHVVLAAGTGTVRRADFRIFNDDGELIAEIIDMQFKRAERAALARLGERWLDECLYETRWDAAASLTQAPHTWSPGQLMSTATARLAALLPDPAVSAYDSHLPKFEALCLDYVVLAMRRLGWQPSVGDAVTGPELADRLRIAPAHRRLFDRLLAILGESGTIARDALAPGSWRVRQPFPDVDPEAVERALSHSCPPGAEAEMELLGRVAPVLAEALRGERDPLQLLFPGGSLDTAERMYRDSAIAIIYNGLLAEVIAAATAMRAAGRTLRILEIGAGTGSSTAHIVARLPLDGVEYTFTDVGPTFVARARERFRSYGFMRFEVLDLERDPQLQGFAGRQFDIVVATNVIHATRELSATLGRVRSLLAPGGLLAMLEITGPLRWHDLTLGLTAGWWSFSDLGLRPEHCSLAPQRWLGLLRNCGFDASTSLDDSLELKGSLALQSLLLARAARERPADTGPWLFFADRDGTCEALAARLRADGAECILVRPGSYELQAQTASIDPAAADGYQRLFTALQASGRRPSGVIHAWSLDTPAWEKMGSAELACAPEYGVVSAMRVAQALVSQGTPPPLWIITRGAQAVDSADGALAPAQAPVWGFAKALALEHPELRCVCVDLAPAPMASEIDALLCELRESGTERAVALRQDTRRVARIARLRRAANSIAPIAGSSASEWRLVIPQAGAFEDLEFVPLARRAPGPGEVEIAVEASALNFKDVLNVLGMYPGDPGPLGGECAGRVLATGAGVTHVSAGDEVMAVAAGSFASHVIAAAHLVQRRPPHVSAEEAASVPIAYLTAQYCLGHLAAMKAGDRVLVHAAAGGVGMAAVRLAQRAGAEVFATAGSDSKRDLLRRMGVAHVFDSRTTAFTASILELTGGRGVDIVLNSLSGELIDASFAALARGGCFVEIGKRGIKEKSWVDTQRRDWRYFVADWTDAAKHEPKLLGDMFAHLTQEWHTGLLMPLPRHVFELNQTSQAFRFMAQARHVGKIVLRHRSGAPLLIRRDGSYLVSGGLSGLGLQAARWLAQHGAGRIVLVGRRGVTSAAAPVLQQLREGGTEVLAEALDVSDEAALTALLERIRADGPPLRGVLHSAGVLDDAELMRQSAERFARVFAPKVQGGRLLDNLTRQDPLEWFVLFASIAGVIGSPGQCNHSAANAFLDVLAHERRKQGLPALSIDWCAWAETGSATDSGLMQRLSERGLGALSSEQGVLALERLMQSGAVQAAVLPVDWSRFLRGWEQGAIPKFFADVAGSVRPGGEGASGAAPIGVHSKDLQRQLADAPVSRQRPIMAAFVRDLALRALGADPAKPVDPRTPLADLGLDSLLAVELRNRLGKALALSLPSTLLFDYPSIEALTDYLLAVVLPASHEGSAAHEEPAAGMASGDSLVDSIESMSDEEVDRLVASRAQAAI
jgi:acyl transferase domain-containing protein/NADPH:quinone reductase-like Zn-dependent oxidoreductase/short-subunit dehydrogenase/acyl carrier protein